MRNRTRGAVSLPMVIRVPYAGGIGGVEHHCDSSEGYYAHTPGLKVVTPSTPADAYSLLRQFFPELETEYRVSIMDTFFDRKRADMACHVFGHMRAHKNPEHRPTKESYTRFFEGIGRSPDLESLRTAHNMLKMDTAVTPDTLVYNGLMIGYTACDLGYRALDFFKEITASAEGPSYQSLEIVFRACEVTPSGDGPARELWDKLLRMEIDVPPEVYAAYVAARAAHGHVDDSYLHVQKGYTQAWVLRSPMRTRPHNSEQCESA